MQVHISNRSPASGSQTTEAKKRKFLPPTVSFDPHGTYHLKRYIQERGISQANVPNVSPPLYVVRRERKSQWADERARILWATTLTSARRSSRVKDRQLFRPRVTRASDTPFSTWQIRFEKIHGRRATPNRFVEVQGGRRFAIPPVAATRKYASSPPFSPHLTPRVQPKAWASKTRGAQYLTREA